MKATKRRARAARRAKSLRMSRWNNVPFTRSKYVAKELRKW